MLNKKHVWALDETARRLYVELINEGIDGDLAIAILEDKFGEDRIYSLDERELKES